MDGLLIVDKPSGPTSHDVVARLRRTLGERRIGHTGTLDPSASGLLAIVLGRATRLARFLTAADKRYEAIIRLGVATDTYDAEGVAVRLHPAGAALPAREAIDRALDRFRGTFEQRPPAFSAKKIGGTRSYALARAGTATPPPAVAVTAHAIDIVECAGDTVALSVVCSAGFYVRSLAHDLGEALGVGAHLTALRRTRSGALDVADALPLQAAEADPARARAAVVPLSAMLPELDTAVLTPEGARRAIHGRLLGPGDIAVRRGGAGPYVRLVHPGGGLVGIATASASTGTLHPSVILM